MAVERLLLETGDYLLLETGDRLLLESSTAGGTAYTLACDAGSYTVTGQDATLTYTPGATPTAYTLDCEAGAFVISGQSAELTWSGAQAQATVRTSVGGFPRREQFRKGYIIKGVRYWLTEEELMVMVAQMLAEISRGDIKQVTAGKPKTISKRTWDAIRPLERLEAVAKQFDDSEDDDEEALLMLL